MHPVLRLWEDFLTDRGVVSLPNPIGQWPFLASAAKWTHILASYVLLLALAGHLGLVFRHQLILKDGLLYRMLPARRADKP